MLNAEILVVHPSPPITGSPRTRQPWYECYHNGEGVVRRVSAPARGSSWLPDLENRRGPPDWGRMRGTDAMVPRGQPGRAWVGRRNRNSHCPFLVAAHAASRRSTGSDDSAPTVSPVSPSSPVSLYAGGSQTFQSRATDTDNNLTKWELEVDKHFSLLHG